MLPTLWNDCSDFQNIDSKGLANSYGSISLKEIKGDKIYFTIKLQYLKQTFNL